MLISLIVSIVVVGVILWAVNQLPMQAQVRNILNVVVVVALILWLLRVFGLLAGVRLP